ncbi:BnaC02g24130D [Brassica napus]|uniref:BnaC02g24130D protein n=2 Tax=Brassica TaxID=3705 RepID=A0A078G700_BRANA|nr:BnaC02g24130D [Brassica napus]
MSRVVLKLMFIALNSLQALKFIHPSPFASPFLRSSLKLPPHLLQFSQSSLGSKTSDI